MEKQFPNMPGKLKKQVADRIKDDKITMIFDGERQYTISKDSDGEVINVKLKTHHKGKCQDGLADFKFEEESEGTQRLMHLSPAFADLAENEKVYFIDELDRKLHPVLSKSLIQLYTEMHTSFSKRQLIFITHESNLLDLEFLPII